MLVLKKEKWIILQRKYKTLSFIPLNMKLDSEGADQESWNIKLDLGMLFKITGYKFLERTPEVGQTNSYNASIPWEFDDPH